MSQPHYDSLLVKCSVSGATFEVARRKMLRALVEFRIRGVKAGLILAARCLISLSRADQYPFPDPSLDPPSIRIWKDLDHVYRRYSRTFQARHVSESRSEAPRVPRRRRGQRVFHYGPDGRAGPQDRSAYPEDRGQSGPYQNRGHVRVLSEGLEEHHRQRRPRSIR